MGKRNIKISGGKSLTKRIKVFVGFLILSSVLMMILLVYILSGNGDWLVQTSYLQSTEQIYFMESGILYHEQAFREGNDSVLKYDFDNVKYQGLLEKCD